MPEYNSPIAVGLAQPSPMLPLTKWAPVTGNISQDPSTWQYGGTNNYPAPFRSFYQQTQQNTYSLGPYARRIDNGLSGRIKVSVVDYPGEMGFVQQCWYDFPRGAFDTDNNGDQYPQNREFWAQSEKAIVVVKDLMGSGDIVVQVAISNRTAADPNVWWFLSPMSGAIANHVHAVINVFTGQGFNGMPGDTSTCGTGDSSGQQKGSLIDLSFSDGNGWGGFGWLFAAGGLADNIFGTMFNALTPAAQAAVGPELDDSNRQNTLAGWINDHLNKLGDFLDKLKDNAELQYTNDLADREEWNERAVRIIKAVGTAADLMINGWFIPNLLQSTSNSQYGDNTLGTTANPYKWRPSDEFQERLAWSMKVDSNTGLPSGDTNFDGVIDARDYVAQSTGMMPDANGNPKPYDLAETDWEHFLTLLNRGDNTTQPYIDTTTNEWVFHENYGFNRGGSISDMDDFLNGVASFTDQQTSDSIGALLDMSPANVIFVGTFIPIVVLEIGGRIIKANKGEPVGALTNLDGYVDTKIEVRISASNMAAGNSAMYNYLLNNGDHLGNKFTAVP
tara:strand:+ start:155 stop:1834 length:1680 start_codon:yes stop_codon:yes gene_type:complete